MNRFVMAAPVIAALVTPAAAGDMEGHWARGDGLARVEVKPCGANVCAVNTWIKPGTPKEKPGDRLVMTIRGTAPGAYDGTAFDPQRDLTYSLAVTVNGDRMTTRGCVLAGLLCRGVDWTRIP